MASFIVVPSTVSELLVAVAVTPVPSLNIKVSEDKRKGVSSPVPVCERSSETFPLESSVFNENSVDISSSETVVKQPAESYSITGIFVVEPAEFARSPSTTVFAILSVVTASSAIIVVDTFSVSLVDTRKPPVIGSVNVESESIASGGCNLILFEPLEEAS